MTKFQIVGLSILTFFLLLIVSFGAFRVFVFIRNHTDVKNTTVENQSKTQSTTIATMSESWTYAMQGADGGKDEMDGVSVDTRGNVIIGGPFENTVDFNDVSHSAKTGVDFYVSKLSPDGKEIWFISVDSGGDDFMWDLTTDKNDDILISGGYGGTLTINSKTYNANRDGSALFAKIDGATGSFVWVQTAGVISSGISIVDPERTAGGNEIKVDSQGNAVAILSAKGDSYKIGSRTYTNKGAMDSFIVKLSPMGEFLWEYQFLGTGRKQARALGINGKDEIAFGHQLIGEISSAEGITISTTNGNIAQGDAGLLTSEGTLKWMIPVISDGFANVRGAGGDSMGNVYFTGVITEASKIGTTAVKGYKNGSTFLAKYTSEGTQEWIRVMGNDENDTAGELITYDNAIVITGGNKGENYNLYDEKGTLLEKDIHMVDSRDTRATLTVFTSEGDITARYSPTYTDASSGGVLEYAGTNCTVFQQMFFGTIKYANGDSYTSRNSIDPSKPDKDIALAKVCIP